MLRQTHIRKALSGVLVVLFAFYYVNANFFWHKHIYCGYVITHSHIYFSNHTNTADGGHDTKQIFLISDLTHTAYNNDVEVYIPDIINTITITFTEHEVARLHSVTPYRFNLRAPPTFLNIA